MGHSWGGAVAVKFAKEHPGKVSRVIFVSAPVSYPETFESMLTRLKNIYKDSVSAAAELEATGNSQKGSIEYASGIFKYAMKGGFYSPKESTEEAKALYAVLFKPEVSKIFANMSGKPSEGFFNNENYLMLDLSADIAALSSNVKFSGIYGDEDGLFEPATLKNISNLTGENNFRVISKASHNVFIDRQDDFINAVEQLTK
jgi:pimeloyl-ACP methyl ester carboxylesterase